MSKNKGIVDPWRIVEPLIPEKQEVEATKKVDIGTGDPEADLRAQGEHTFVGSNYSIRVRNAGVTTTSIALRHLIMCLFELPPDQWKDTGIGVKIGKHERYVPKECQMVTLETATSDTQDTNLHGTLYMAASNLAEGISSLATVLLKIKKTTKGKTILAQYGVEPLLR